MLKCKNIVFDMDDTLYLERDFAFSGYESIAKKLAGEVESEKCLEFLQSRFLNGHYTNQFNALLKEFPQITNTKISDLIDVYRYHKPQISLSAEVIKVLHTLKADYTLGLISDGDELIQSNKVEALGLSEFIDEDLIVLTGKYGSDFFKPADRAYLEIEEKTGFSQKENVYIADNQKKDFIAPNKLNWKSILISMEGQIYRSYRPQNVNEKANCEIGSISEIVGCQFE
jgi:putative hydrolase of the HAD superfamily